MLPHKCGEEVQARARGSGCWLLNFTAIANTRPGGGLVGRHLGRDGETNYQSLGGEMPAFVWAGAAICIVQVIVDVLQLLLIATYVLRGEGRRGMPQ